MFRIQYIKLCLKSTISERSNFRCSFCLDASHLLSKMYKTVEKGSKFTENYAVYFQNENGPISPFHDIPLYTDNSKKLLNMVVEIPRWTNAKMEINVKGPLNPIKQDVKKGKMRFVKNCFPHHGYIWNYGAFPQTWENPLHIDENTKSKGDNDPIDVIEIGSKVAQIGSVLSVKVLGCFALIDDGETDWKIITIDNEDELAPKVNDLQDVEKFFPGLLKASIEWLKIYKIPDGKPENKFAFNGEPKNKEFTMKIIDEVHKFWEDLVCGKVDNTEISCSNSTLTKNKFNISMDKANEIVRNAPEPGPAHPIPKAELDKWHFVKIP